MSLLDIHDPSVVYRDATYSAETQDALESLLRRLELTNWAWDERHVPALRDVVQRWDANDATETIFT